MLLLAVAACQEPLSASDAAAQARYECYYIAKQAPSTDMDQCVQRRADALLSQDAAAQENAKERRSRAFSHMGDGFKQ